MDKKIHLNVYYDPWINAVYCDEVPSLRGRMVPDARVLDWVKECPVPSGTDGS